jgi:raffinose/stachyose/melibiose transport system permease protein
MPVVAGDRVFRQAVINSLLFSLGGAVVQLLFGMAMAVVLLSLPSFRNLTRAAFFIPSIISSVAISQIFVQLLAVNPEGIFNGLLGLVGLGAWKAFLGDPNLSLAIVTLVDAYKFSAIYMAIYYAALASIDAELIDAAHIDGANWWQTLYQIRIPVIRSTVIATVVLVISGTLKGFDISFIMTNGGPGVSSELVSTYLYKTLFNSSNFGYGSAIAVFLAVECLVAVLLIQWVFAGEEKR